MTVSAADLLDRECGATRVIGIVNVTADSFSDGGRYLVPAAAVEHGVRLVESGADIVDVGGESTRPGATRVDPDTERERVVPVVRELAAAGITVSIDTMRSSVAEAAIAAGASIVNDVSGGRADPLMASVAAATGVPWILMHWRPTAADAVAGVRFAHRADDVGGYRDVVTEVSSELLTQVDAAVGAGVAADRIVLDPGLGFAKAAEHNWALLHALPALVDVGFPVLIGASRKRFLGTLLTQDGATPRPPDGRETATAAVSALAAAHGVWGVRVHDVQASRDAIAVAAAWSDGGRRGRLDRRASGQSTSPAGPRDRSVRHPLTTRPAEPRSAQPRPDDG